MSETTKTYEVDFLFSGEPLSKDKVFEIRQRALRDGEEYEHLANLVEEQREQKPSGERAREHAERLGLALWILGRYAEAAEYLETVKTRREAAYFLALCRLELGHCEEALDMLKRIAKSENGDFRTAIAIVDAMRRLGDARKAIDELEHLAKTHGDEPDLHYQLGRCLQDIGEYESAFNSYERALELDPNHAQAAFHLGFGNDLRGNDEEGMRHYEDLRNMPVMYPNALINLGLLYEDMENYRGAIECYSMVLAADPTNPRARMFLKDARASLTMYYDEEKERRADRRNAVLDTPVTDFELSVRSRNCLEKMGIRTLGDLTRVTEADLLNFKNFGETSLGEIKRIMASKGLRLGQALEESPEDEEALGLLPEETVDRVAILQKPISDLNLSVRCRRCMERLGVNTLGDLVTRTEEELLACRNFGETSMNEVKSKLREYGLSLRKSDD